MRDLTPVEIEKLILGYEELEPADRALADRYLEAHPDLAARLAWHQAKEVGAAANLPVADAAWQVGDLSAGEDAARHESLRRILAEVTVGQGTAGGGSVGRVRDRAAWLLPLAAILALALLLPQAGVEKSLLRNLTVARVEMAVDASRGSGRLDVTDGALFTGEAFALDFRLDEDAYVVVYHVDPAGRVSMVHPESPADEATPLRGGRNHRIPDPRGGLVWVLGAETGVESFLVASARRPPAGVAGLASDAVSADRAATLARLRSRLADLMDEVELHEFDHVD